MTVGCGVSASDSMRLHAIDEEVLPRLEDLKDLGVALVGHRRTLLDAIAALRGDANAKEPSSETLPHAPASAQASAPPATVAPTAEAVGERRYLTVMFCDLVGSTSISAQLDDEEWRDLVGAYLDAASAAVTGMGGHVARKLGDGLMALFGYPVAHENDAERAARAALAIQRALTELNRKNEGIGKPVLTARIGLESWPGGARFGGRDLWRRRQYRCAGAGAGRAGRGLGHGASAASSRRPVRCGRAWHAYAQGRARAQRAVQVGAGERRWTTLGAAQSDAAGRPRR